MDKYDNGQELTRLFWRGGKGKLVFSKSYFERVNNNVDKAYLISVMSLDFLKITTNPPWLSRSLISLLKKLRCHRMGRSLHGLIIGKNQTRYNEYSKWAISTQERSWSPGRLYYENVVSVFGREQAHWILRFIWKGTGNKIENVL